MSSFIDANLRISQDEAKEFEDKLQKAEVEVSRFGKELEETKRELKLLENHDMIVSLGDATVPCMPRSYRCSKIFSESEKCQQKCQHCSSNAGPSWIVSASRNEQLERQRVYGETLIKATDDVSWVQRLPAKGQGKTSGYVGPSNDGKIQ